MIDFGKHAVFIWGSYGIAIGALFLIALASYRRMRALEKAVEMLRQARAP
jgi:heme exporter protein CcmD